MFTEKQYVTIRSKQKEVVIDVLRRDLKPGVVVYETRTSGGKFAGFYQEDELSSITEYVTDAQWDNYAKRIERKNLREHGRSLTFSGIASRARNFIVDIQSDRKMMIVYQGWRDAMKQEDLANVS